MSEARTIRIDIPGLRTKSLANMREHWAAKAKRAKAEWTMARVMTRGKLDEIKTAYIITLTRVAPRKMDDDNLRGALKAVRDGVASALRVDDATPLIEWRYAQEKSKQCAVRIEIGEDDESRDKR